MEGDKLVYEKKTEVKVGLPGKVRGRGIVDMGIGHKCKQRESE